MSADQIKTQLAPQVENLVLVSRALLDLIDHREVLLRSDAAIGTAVELRRVLEKFSAYLDRAVATMSASELKRME